MLVKGVEQEVYDNIQKYIPGQLMASGEMLDGQVVSVEPRAHEQTVTVDTTDGTLEIPVDEGTIDLLFTIECNVVNPITTEIGTQEVRVGKTHTVKTDKFELMNGVILDCEWGDGAARPMLSKTKEHRGRRRTCRRPSLYGGNNMPEWFLNLDGGILLWLQEAVRNAVLTPLFTLYTHLGDSGLMWIALSVLLLCFKKTRKAGAAGLMALLLSLMFTNGILKHLVERPRPWLTVEGLTPLIAEHDPNSFPSGHTSASFAAASAWCRTLPRRWMGVTAVVLAALMGFSRLYVGVHFPSDVLAGVLVGLFCGWLACLLWQRFAAWRGLEA